MVSVWVFGRKNEIIILKSHILKYEVTDTYAYNIVKQKI